MESKTAEKAVRHINIKLGEELFTLAVSTTDEREEQSYRRATTTINRLFEQYRNAYPTASRADLYQLVSLHIAQQCEWIKIEGEELNLESRLGELNNSISALLSEANNKEQEY